MSRDLDRDFVRNFSQYLGRELDREFFQGFAQYFERYFFRFFGQNFGRCFVRDFGRHYVRDVGRDFGRELHRDLGYFKPIVGAAWLATLTVLDGGSAIGRAAPRVTLAHGEVPEGVPLLALFRSACQASFVPGDARLGVAVDRACAAFEGDPLWPALARHVARISTSEDRALLEDLARHPEKREPPLSWGLQHYVRGDLVFDDDSVVTLDELCAQAGVPPLPLLEAMPDELNIALDEASP
jgi:hypothetical protein